MQQWAISIMTSLNPTDEDTGSGKMLAQADIPLSYAGSSWYVAITNIGCQKRAALGLGAIGFRTFLPVYTEWVTHARLRKIKEKPLLDRYLFVEVDPNQQSFEKIRQTDGVESLLTTMGMPISVPGHFVTDLLQRQLTGEFDFAAKERLPNRAIVEIVEGIHENLRGVLLSYSTRRGAMVKLLGQRTTVRVSPVSLRAAV
jgi:transcription antitermination factor NusG